MAKIYACFNLDQCDLHQMESYLIQLPPERKAKALRYRREIDRNTCVVSYLILCYALYKEHNIRNPKLSYGKWGKPYLTDYPDIHFNISHCSNGCVCAISSTQIGVDIQDIRPFSQAVAERCCSANELRILASANNPADMFTRIWTMKEAYLKLLGIGITQDLSTVDTTILSDRIKIHKRDGCYLAVADATSFQEA